MRHNHHPIMQVAAGVIKNSAGDILIAKRDSTLHQGGLWEFPGGKIENGETAKDALIRELKEELDISAEQTTPLITLRHSYPDRTVDLHVFVVERFSGLAKGCQGQPIIWISPADLSNYQFPAANRPIITAAQLPPYYAILDDCSGRDLITDLGKLLTRGIKLIQARLKTLPANKVDVFLTKAIPLCARYDANLLLNSAAASGHSACQSLHLTSTDLISLGKRPERIRWLSASCHSLSELEHAQFIGVDFAVVAPVKPTQTHPKTLPLGWDGFSALVNQSNLPVYALGGLTLSDLTAAREAGGQGIAGISAFLT